MHDFGRGRAVAADDIEQCTCEHRGEQGTDKRQQTSGTVRPPGHVQEANSEGDGRCPDVSGDMRWRIVELSEDERGQALPGQHKAAPREGWSQPASAAQAGRLSAHQYGVDEVGVDRRRSHPRRTGQRRHAHLIRRARGTTVDMQFERLRFCSVERIICPGGDQLTSGLTRHRGMPIELVVSLRSHDVTVVPRHRLVPTAE